MIETMREEDTETVNYWKNILNEISSNILSDKKSYEGYTLLVLGDRSAGKTQFVSNIAPDAVIPTKKGAGLQFIPIEIFDSSDNKEILTTLEVWILDGDTAFEKLLKYAVSSTTIIENKLFVSIVLDMSQPWDCMKSLKKWVNVLENYINSLNLSQKEIQKLHRNYTEKFLKPKSIISSKSPIDFDHKKDEIELSESDENNDNIISTQVEEETSDLDSRNLGFPLFLVGTKTDTFSQLEVNHKINGDCQDLIQVHLREFCLKYGAGLMYTNSKTSNNNKLFYNYITKILYEFESELTPNVIDRESIFIPIGWDKKVRIEMLKESIRSLCPDDPIDIHIHNPFDKERLRSHPVDFPDETKLYQQLEENLLKEQSSIEPHISQSKSAINFASISTMSNDSASFTSKSQKSLAAPNNADNSGELANFFNTLLTGKKASTPSKK